MGPPGIAAIPTRRHATQYTASSFAQPIRRVFGTLVFRASEQIEMPPPLRCEARSRSSCSLADVIWDTLYAPIARGVEAIADWLNRLQYLSIRHYLGFVFVSLVGLLLMLAIWP